MIPPFSYSPWDALVVVEWMSTTQTDLRPATDSPPLLCFSSAPPTCHSAIHKSQSTLLTTSSGWITSSRTPPSRPSHQGDHFYSWASLFQKRATEKEPFCQSVLCRGQQGLSVKGQIINILGFKGLNIISVAHSSLLSLQCFTNLKIIVSPSSLQK